MSPLQAEVGCQCRRLTARPAAKNNSILSEQPQVYKWVPIGGATGVPAWQPV